LRNASALFGRELLFDVLEMLHLISDEIRKGAVLVERLCRRTRYVNGFHGDLLGD
jgi:hypothetical protein